MNGMRSAVVGKGVAASDLEAIRLLLMRRISPPPHWYMQAGLTTCRVQGEEETKPMTPKEAEGQVTLMMS